MVFKKLKIILVFEPFVAVQPKMVYQIHPQVRSIGGTGFFTSTASRGKIRRLAVGTTSI